MIFQTSNSNIQIDLNEEKQSFHLPGKGISDSFNLRIYQGNHLPHWELGHAVYHACFSLKDSVPKHQRNEWLEERRRLNEIIIKGDRELTEFERERLRKLYTEKIEYYLDNGSGSCILKAPEIASIVRDSLLFFNNVRYVLHAWCIMPNHVHAMFHALDGYNHSRIIHGWKSFSAHGINKLLGKEGNVWHTDTYTHIIRTESEYFNQMLYIWKNPTKAGLETMHTWNWKWMCNDALRRLYSDIIQ